MCVCVCVQVIPDASAGRGVGVPEESSLQAGTAVEEVHSGQSDCRGTFILQSDSGSGNMQTNLLEIIICLCDVMCMMYNKGGPALVVLIRRPQCDTSDLEQAVTNH